VGENFALKFTIFSAFVIIIAFLGITGTWDEVQRCDLVVYLVLIISIISAQIVFVIYTIMNEDSLKEWLEDIWEDWSESRKEKAMSSYKCGLYSTMLNNIGLGGVVINTNPVNMTNCVNFALTVDYCFEDCYSKAKDSITILGVLTITFLTVFALLELMLLISTFALVCNRKKEEIKPHYHHQRKDLQYRRSTVSIPIEQLEDEGKREKDHTRRGKHNIEMTRGEVLL